MTLMFPKTQKKSKKDKFNRKAYTKKLDIQWSKAVKVLAGYACEYCGKTEHLNSHHFYGRRVFPLRWNAKNGVCLCAGHHTFSSTFSAHQTEPDFNKWIIENRGEDWADELREVKIEAHKFSNEELVKIYLHLKQINS